MKHKRLILNTLVMLGIGLTGAQAQTVKDIEGHVYKTVQIGTQEWMSENLKTTKFNDETDIPLITDSIAWRVSPTSGALYCWYNNDSVTYKNTYGALYTWFTVSTGKLCPTGWHVPTNSEWKILISYLGGKKVAGGKLKETGIEHWNNPNAGSTNEVSFTALPGGCRGNDGTFSDIGNVCFWWSATEFNSFDASIFFIYNFLSNMIKIDDNKLNSCSVRCVKD
jgi:uncharacterized protein (TIGR02145 family)